MGRLDPRLMGRFRRKIVNPHHYRRVYGVLRSYRCSDLRHPAGAYGMVDRLSRCLNEPVTPQERHHAAHWLMNCGVDPQHPGHRRRMWRMIRGGW
jgi:hypothetical protein